MTNINQEQIDKIYELTEDKWDNAQSLLDEYLIMDEMSRKEKQKLPYEKMLVYVKIKCLETEE